MKTQMVPFIFTWAIVADFNILSAGQKMASEVLALAVPNPIPATNSIFFITFLIFRNRTGYPSPMQLGLGN